MRKIEQDIINAIQAKQSKSFSNTTVVHVNDSGSISVYLHGNQIALIYPESVQLSSCGWRTPTTKVRINCVLDALGINQSVSQIKGFWYVWQDGLKRPFEDNMSISY